MCASSEKLTPVCPLAEITVKTQAKLFYGAMQGLSNFWLF
jgi:hypothetical protein